MSHFCTVVILPPDVSRERAAVKAAVEPLMSRYYLEREVQPYIRPCWCIDIRNTRAHKMAEQRADAEVGSYWEAVVDRGEPFPEWKRRYRASLEAAREAAPVHHRFNLGCFDCKGTGEYVTTENPEGTHSSWRFADEALPLHRWLEGSWSELGVEAITTTEVLIAAFKHQGDAPFAVVTPDGEWHQQGQIGEWVDEWERHDDWPGEVVALVEQYLDHPAAVLDCHR